MEPERGQEGRARRRPRPRRNVGKTPIMVAMTGGRGAAFAAGPGFGRLGPPPFREAANREPLDAVKVLLAAGANPNAKAPDGSTPLHQAVSRATGGDHSRAGRGGCEAGRDQQGQSDAAAAGRKTRASAAARATTTTRIRSRPSAIRVRQ